MSNIKQISVVYNLSAPYIILEYETVQTATGKTKDQLCFEELGANIQKFQYQQEILGKYINFTKGYYMMNNKSYNAIIINQSDTPQPEVPIKGNITVYNGVYDPAELFNIVFFRDSINVNAIDWTIGNPVGYFNTFPGVPCPHVQPIRGTLSKTGGAFVCNYDNSGTEDDISIIMMGSVCTQVNATITTGVHSLIIPYSCLPGESVSVLLLYPALPPIVNANRSGTISNVNGADGIIGSVTIQATNAIYHDGNNLPMLSGQSGGFVTMQNTANRTVIVTMSTPPSFPIPGVNVRVTGCNGSTQTLPYNGSGTYTFNNVDFSAQGVWTVQII